MVDYPLIYKDSCRLCQESWILTALYDERSLVWLQPGPALTDEILAAVARDVERETTSTDFH
ncbi:MAG: hypothetical protein ACREOE_16855, partial [Gemmatimonadales bacterium]